MLLSFRYPFGHTVIGPCAIQLTRTPPLTGVPVVRNTALMANRFGAMNAPAYGNMAIAGAESPGPASTDAGAGEDRKSDV